jgi:hypothetical protein
VAVWPTCGVGSEPVTLKVPVCTATAGPGGCDIEGTWLGPALGVADGLGLELASALDTAPAFVWKRSQTPDRITAATNVIANAPAAALTGARPGRGASS